MAQATSEEFARMQAQQAMGAKATVVMRGEKGECSIPFSCCPLL